MRMMKTLEEVTTVNTHDATLTRAARFEKWFNRIVLGAILISIYVTLWSFLGDESELMEDIDVGILWFFLIEVSARLFNRIRKARWGFWRDGWLMFDLVVITLSLMPLGGDVIALRIMRAARLAHVGRHMTHLRHHVGVFRWLSAIKRVAK